MHKPMDLWTSPEERLEPFGTCGQTDGQRFALPTACPHAQASHPQIHRLNNNNFVNFFILLGGNTYVLHS
jgi:hypothetical protein